MCAANGSRPMFHVKNATVVPCVMLCTPWSMPEQHWLDRSQGFVAFVEQW